MKSVIETKIRRASEILRTLGLPKEQQNQMSALTLLALAGLSPGDKWKEATSKSLTVTKGVMAFIADRYGKKYAPNTRETFRRQVLHQFVQGHIADYNPDDQSLPTNSPKAHYALTQEAVEVIQSWKTDRWEFACRQFHKKYGSLFELYQSPRKIPYVPLTLSSGRQVKLSPGRHNELQVAVVMEFGPRFMPGAVLVYIGDTAQKNLVLSQECLKQINVELSDHSKLPDVILFDSRRNWLVLVEAVTSHGPMTPKRIIELKEIFSASKAGLIFVSAFPDLAEFRKHIRQIAWDTEVWIAEIPDHMIHYNGDKFLGPR